MTTEGHTLCDMIASASDHVIERYDSELALFISRSRELAAFTKALLAELHEASELCFSGHSQVAEELCHKYSPGC